jgi:hypothetical protein
MIQKRNVFKILHIFSLNLVFHLWVRKIRIEYFMKILGAYFILLHFFQSIFDWKTYTHRYILFEIFDWIFMLEEIGIPLKLLCSADGWNIKFITIKIHCFVSSFNVVHLLNIWWTCSNFFQCLVGNRGRLLNFL